MITLILVGIAGFVLGSLLVGFLVVGFLYTVVVDIMKVLYR